MVIHSPQPTNGSPNSRWAPRTGSLYEDIPLFGTFDICVSSSSTSSSLRSIISCVLLLLLLYCVVHGSSSSRSRYNWLNRDYLFFGFWQKSHKSHTAGDRPCTRSLVYLTTDRRLAESWTGTVFFCFVFFSGGKSRTFRSLFFLFWFPLLNWIDFNCSWLQAG